MRLWLWLWCRPAATAPIRPLAWEPPCAMGQPSKGKIKNLKKFLKISGVQAPGDLIFSVLSLTLRFLDRNGSSGAEFENHTAPPKFGGGSVPGLQKFLVQGSNLSHSGDSAESLTARPPGICPFFPIFECGA